jgi:hypothetical protein
MCSLAIIPEDSTIDIEEPAHQYYQPPTQPTQVQYKNYSVATAKAPSKRAVMQAEVCSLFLFTFSKMAF